VRRGIGFDHDTFAALDRLVRDRNWGRANDVFRDLLKNYRRQVTLKEMVCKSVRSQPANDRHSRTTSSAMPHMY
jgi:hypothetical protein